MIFPEIFPRSSYKICPIIPQLFPVSNSNSPVPTTFPQIQLHSPIATTGDFLLWENPIVQCTHRAVKKTPCIMSQFKQYLSKSNRSSQLHLNNQVYSTVYFAEQLHQAFSLAVALFLGRKTAWMLDKTPPSEQGSHQQEDCLVLHRS